MGDQGKDSAFGSMAYKGTLAGLKGLLSEKLNDSLHTVKSTIDKIAEPEDAQSSSVKIPIDIIRPCVDQPRQVFEPESLERLAQTLKELGQAQAITVRKKENHYEIISGERRFRAAKLAGLTHMDCMIKDVEGKEARLLSLVENLQRKDLLPIEEAHFLKKVLGENPDLSLEKMARLLGTHKSTLSEKIQLTEVPLDQQEKLFNEDTHFTHRHWRVVSRIKDPAFLSEMTANAIDNRLSVAELERSLEAAGITKAKRKRSQSTDGQLPLKGFELYRMNGPKIRIKSSTFELERLTSEHKKKLITDLESLLSLVRAS